MTVKLPRTSTALRALMTLALISTSACATNSSQTGSAQEADTVQSQPGQSDTAPEATEFPRTVMLPNGTFTVYEPQIEDHAGFTEITASSAAVYRANDNQPTYGAIKFSADIVVDKDNRLVTIFDRTILEMNFSELDDAQAAALTTTLSANIRTEPETMPLDVVLGYVAEEAAKDISVKVSLDPPTILYATKPTLLVVIDGDPIKVAVEDAEGLSIIVNTNWDLFYAKAADKYFLLLGDTWLSASTLEDQWTQTKAPDGISALPDEDRWKAAKAAILGGSIPADEMPDIVVVEAPAELIVTKGPAELEAVPGTRLSFVANTSSDIVYSADDRYYYYLTSGRWFKATGLDGNWSSVTALPADFQSIPAGHPRGHVRASIPGTEEATLAVAQAQIPQTAEVSRTIDAPKVIYAGDAPEFAKIEGVNVYLVTNTIFDVFRVDGKYYLCHEAVWFVADDPNGPWRVTDMIPAEMYQIPANSTAHHVTYVKVYESTPETIYFGYTPGYHYSYVSGGVVVYGSGYYWGSYYNPYYYTYYPSYYYAPYPYTYGQASIYQVNTGTYAHGHYAYGPYGGYGQSSRYNTNTGRYGSSAYAYDYDTAVYEGWSYNPRTDISTNSSQAIQWSDSNSYEAWGETVVQRDDNWVKTERYATEDGFRREAQTSEGGQAMQVGNYDSRATVAQTSDGDLYAGANGNVYRRTEDGQWETNSNGEWSGVNTAGARDSVQATANDKGIDTSSISQSDRFSDTQRNNWQTSDIQRLERDHSARTGGRSRYDSFKADRSGSFSGGRSFGGRRR
ncbi:MAG: hypothetical protein AAFR51_04960 [Pseudomonadota bacterium]